MTFPERAPIAASMCPGMGGGCAACDKCPFAENIRKGSTLPGKIISFSEFSARKISVRQEIPVSLGGPVPEVRVACIECKDGSCSKHRKAA